MVRWGTRTYVNCYFTHIIGVSLLCLSPLGQLCLFYMHLYSCFILHLHCNTRHLLEINFLNNWSFINADVFCCSEINLNKYSDKMEKAQVVMSKQELRSVLLLRTKNSSSDKVNNAFRTSIIYLKQNFFFGIFRWSCFFFN